MRAAWTWLRRLLRLAPRPRPRRRARRGARASTSRCRPPRRCDAAGRPRDAARAARLRLGGGGGDQGSLPRPAGHPRRSTRSCRTCATPPVALRRDAGFALIAVATLTLGIGATTTIFSLVRGVLLDPLPYPEAGRLIASTSRTRSSRRSRSGRTDCWPTATRTRRLPGSRATFAKTCSSPSTAGPNGCADCRSRATTSRCSACARRIGRAVHMGGGARARRRGHPQRRGVARAVPGGSRRGRPRRAPERSPVHDRRRHARRVRARRRHLPQLTGQGETVDVWWPLPLEKASRRQGLALHQRGRAPEAWCHACRRRGPISPRCRRESGAATTAGGTFAPCRCSTTSSGRRATRIRAAAAASAW